MDNERCDEGWEVLWGLRRELSKEVDRLEEIHAELSSPATMWGVGSLEEAEAVEDEAIDALHEWEAAKADLENFGGNSYCDSIRGRCGEGGCEEEPPWEPRAFRDDDDIPF